VNERYPLPPGKVFTLHGRGFGHGHGMSQWGAYGAAKVDGLSANQILAFYYPGTTLKTENTTHTIRVLLTAADAPATGYLQVAPADGLSEMPSGGAAVVLPTESAPATAGAATYPITAWRLQQSGDGIALRSLWNGKWHTRKKDLGPVVTFADTAAVLEVDVPGAGPGAGAARTVDYRGAIKTEIRSGHLEPVNDVPIDAYIGGVVPSEMPSSWTAAALQAQAVAARTYAWRLIGSPKASWFDIYGDTRDQAYGGSTVETSATNKAVHVTAGEVVVGSDGKPIFAQYASADGGWTESGGQPYLPAQADPYDGAVPSDAHSWTASVSAASIAAAFPSVGTVKKLLITQRDGHGAWGGRVTAISVVGTTATVQTTGTAFQADFGLRSPWFRPIPPPAAPTSVKAKVTKRSVQVTWKAPVALTGAAAITGYYVSVRAVGLSTAHTKTVAPTALTATLTKLPKGTYTVKVLARSSAGPSIAAAARSTVVVKAAH
jgi:SpoIID/LytB domain protein